MPVRRSRADIGNILSRDSHSCAPSQGGIKLGRLLSACFIIAFFLPRVFALQTTLTWTDNSSDESGFQIERSADGTTFAQIATVGANTTAYSDTGLGPGVYWYRVRAYDASSTSDYTEVVQQAVSLPDASPVFTTQPVGQSVLTGASVVLSAAVTGLPAPVVQWYKDGTLIAGATSLNLTFSSAAMTSTGVYTIVATNRAGTATSNSATLSVATPPPVDVAPVISAQPASLTAAVGSNVTFTVGAGGAPSPTYQWYLNGVAIANATSPTLALSALTLQNAGKYTVTASNRAGAATSAPAQLTVTAAVPADSIPVFSGQPSSATVTAGMDVSFAVTAVGYPSPTLQWYQNGAAIAGATGATLTLPAVASVNAGNYTVIATNRAGTATSSGALLTVSAPPSADSAPIFTLQPAAASVSAGADVSFNVSASGSPTPAYQWFRNGVAIGGATNSALSLLTVTSQSSGNYTATATNRAGTASSTVAALTISTPPPADTAPVFTLQPTGVSVSAGANVTFTVIATGAPAPSFQWFRNGVAVVGANSSTLSFPAVATQSAGNYTVTASNRAGTATSSLAALNVAAGTSSNTAPVITQQPVSQTAVVGATATFSVTATGTPAPAIKWNKDGADLPSTNSSLLTLSNITAGSAGSYAAILSNSSGTVVSIPVTLTVATSPIVIVKPTFTLQPTAQTSLLGGTAKFTVAVAGTPVPTIQWRKNGITVSGANDLTLTLTNIVASDAASYTAIATNVSESITSGAATLTISASASAPTVAADPSSRLAALSVRAVAGADSQTLIVGFVVSQNSKSMLVRAIGPSLAPYTSATIFADPKLTVYKDSTPTMSNDNWGGGTAMKTLFSRVGAFPLDDASKDAAVNPTLLPGAYTAQVSGTGAGMTLVELYDADNSAANTGRLVDVAARASVGTGDDVLIAGFQISGTKTKQIMIRGIGPTLADLGVGDVLMSPQIDLYHDGAMIRHTESWGGDPAIAKAFTQVGAFPLPLTSQDSVLLVTLDPGAYTAILSGQNMSKGVALIEIYEMP